MSHPYSRLFYEDAAYVSGATGDKAVAASFVFNFEKTSNIEETFDDGTESYQVQVRLVDDSLDLPEFEVHMLGIPIASGQGKEVVAKWRLINSDLSPTSLSSDETFYTDSNGLEMQKRILNYRPTWTLSTDMKVAANYYPINSAISIRSTLNGTTDSTSVQMTVMNDRAQGGASIENGSIELMQNRRLLYDDDRGLERPLNETDPKTGMGIEVNALYKVQLMDAS